MRVCIGEYIYANSLAFIFVDLRIFFRFRHDDVIHRHSRILLIVCDSTSTHCSSRLYIALAMIVLEHKSSISIEREAVPFAYRFL